MGIVESVISKLITPAVAEAMSAALGPIRDRLALLEAAPGLAAEDRAILEKAAAIVAEFEALADREIEVPEPSVGGDGGSVTVPEIQ